MSSSPLWDDNATIEFVSLVSGGQSFCLEITTIREIRRWSAVTPLPYSEDSVLGVMNLRGAVIPIVDLAARLGLGRTDPTARHVIIVVAVHQRTLGLLVDSVSEILTVKGGAIRETPNVRSDDSIRSIRGLLQIEEEMSRIIDLSALLPAEHEDAA
ncbi:chemotaxis protein CheW [Wenxinia marina]|uniref:Chemotaxis signal transduction protein n=1 Tax=Wenxinia marina DSM 24838 TaxID=1123501 RepID=A0A0D0NGE7_9RHOB|nr:chemotaxis protein CheW [Wenxinia marina]KIQ67405.1 Chemotaxis signal transduction protein [Wenxinia marina DSM 24838]GGL69747.1 chemotaxis protein CheW [Wenxinia marina]